MRFVGIGLAISMDSIQAYTIALCVVQVVIYSYGGALVVAFVL